VISLGYEDHRRNTDSLILAAKQYAEEHHIPFREVVELGLRRVLSESSGKTKPFKLKKGAFKGKGMVKDYTWPEIRAMIYEGRGG
jgi:hypothetical protein